VPFFKRAVASANLETWQADRVAAASSLHQSVVNTPGRERKTRTRAQRVADAADDIIHPGSPRIAVRSRTEGKSVKAGCSHQTVCLLDPRGRCYTELSRLHVHTTMRSHPNYFPVTPMSDLRPAITRNWSRRAEKLHLPNIVKPSLIVIFTTPQLDHVAIQTFSIPSRPGDVTIPF
jgi:hypothetical protein